MPRGHERPAFALRRIRLGILVQLEGRERELDLFVVLVEDFDAQDCGAARGHFRPPLVNHQMSLEPGPLDIFADREKVFRVPSFQDDLCLALVKPLRSPLWVAIVAIQTKKCGPDRRVGRLSSKLSSAHSQALIGDQIHDEVTHKSP
jgi:hypothetical protein